MVRIFHEVRRNSRSIATNFGEYTGNFNKPEIIGLDQSIPSPTQHRASDATQLMYSFLNLLFITGLISTVVISDSPVAITAKHVDRGVVSKDAISPGYSALKLFLEDEQYLTTIRRTKMVFTFSSISDKSVILIDKISDTSEQAIEDLEKLSHEKPAFSFEAFSDDGIGKATFDSLRYTTAKEFFFDGENFEKDLLISQLKVLRLISHLAIEIEEKESNARRKKWLHKIAVKYESYYQSIDAQFFISAKK